MGRKYILTTVLFLFSIVLAMGQERVDGSIAELSWKSKEIKKALYWSQNSKTGKWESRKCTKLVYLGEGVNVDNFHNLFTGIYEGHRYLFLDKRHYFWRYPALKQEWVWERTMYAALLSDEDWNSMKGLTNGQTLIVKPSFTNDLSRAHNEYSFPFFLKLTETLRSCEDKPSNIPFITLRRFVGSDGKDVVRFCFGAVTELIDISYFEIPYTTYELLFQPDEKNSVDE